MSTDAWITLATVGVLLFALMRNLASPDVLFVAAVCVLAVCGVITVPEAFVGFSNAGMLTVAALFVAAAGLRETGVLDYLGHHVLGKAQNERTALLRLSVVVVPLSAFLNNTPVVAMFVPIVLEWCRQRNVSPSRVLMPLSFLTILGGTCSLIGTSTNLVIQGLMIENGIRGMGLFEIGKIGLPYAIIGITYMLLFRRVLLPERKELFAQLGETRREYLIEMEIQPNCRLVGQTVEKAGLRHLSGLFLIEITRGETVIAPVAPDAQLLSGDRLVFTGVVQNILDLEKIDGLVPAVDPTYEVSPRGQRQRRLCEAVISEYSPLIGKTIRNADFRAAYGAAVVAVHRSGRRVESKVGDIRLRPGDTLLLQVGPHFLRAHRNDPAFYLVSDVDDWRPLRRDRAGVAMSLFVGMLILMTTGVVDVVLAAILAAVGMILTGCLSAGEARKSIEWQVLVTIAAAFGVGTAMQKSGLAGEFAQWLVDSTEAAGPIAVLAAIYLVGSLLTEVITNNAAAVLMFPFCIETAARIDGGVSVMPFLIALTLSASASFMTPIGYQTNMMVYGPGGYRFSDFFRFGGPLNLVLMLVAVCLIPLIWPFHPPLGM